MIGRFFLTTSQESWKYLIHTTKAFNWRLNQCCCRQNSSLLYHSCIRDSRPCRKQTKSQYKCLRRRTIRITSNSSSAMFGLQWTMLKTGKKTESTCCLLCLKIATKLESNVIQKILFYRWSTTTLTKVLPLKNSNSNFCFIQKIRVTVKNSLALFTNWKDYPLRIVLLLDLFVT